MILILRRFNFSAPKNFKEVFNLIINIVYKYKFIRITATLI